MERRRIAFGWRGTLVPMAGEFDTEGRSLLAGLAYKAQLRAGTRQLMKALQRQGWDICIYTLDFLPAWRIRLFFALQGIPLREVITKREHRTAFKGMYAPSPNTKYPPTFDIDLIVDDKQETREAGQKLGFATYLIPPGQADWQKHLLESVDAL